MSANDPKRTLGHSAIACFWRYHRGRLGAPIKMSRSSSAVSPDWVNIREAVLRRDNYKCLECGTPCRAAEADVHHLLPRSAEGTDEPSNLVTLCDGCHAAAAPPHQSAAYEIDPPLDRHEVDDGPV